MNDHGFLFSTHKHAYHILSNIILGFVWKWSTQHVCRMPIWQGTCSGRKGVPSCHTMSYPYAWLNYGDPQLVKHETTRVPIYISIYIACFLTHCIHILFVVFWRFQQVYVHVHKNIFVESFQSLCIYIYMYQIVSAYICFRYIYIWYMYKQFWPDDVYMLISEFLLVLNEKDLTLI